MFYIYIHCVCWFFCTIFFFICDVIWENPVFWGATNVFLDQPFRYVYIHILLLKGAESEKGVFCRCWYVTQSRSSDQTPRRARRLTRACYFCPSMSRLFPHDVPERVRVDSARPPSRKKLGVWRNSVLLYYMYFVILLTHLRIFFVPSYGWKLHGRDQLFSLTI